MRKKYSGKTQNIISAVVWGFLVLSAGLLLFWLGRLKMLQARGGTLGVQNLQPQVEKLFRLSGLHRVIDVQRKGGRL